MRKRGSKHRGGRGRHKASPASSPQQSGRHGVGKVVPSVTENLAASTRVLDMMETERNRDQFRAETLAVLKGQGDREKHAEMTRVFAREKRLAEKMIQQMLVNYVPRPLPRASSHSGGGSASSSPKGGHGGGRISARSGGLGGPSPLQRDAMMLQSMQASAGTLRTTFSTKNRLPGATLEIQPPTIPADVNTETLELAYHRPMAGDGKTVVEPSVRGLISGHTQAVDLDFPEIEKYKRPEQEFARWKEKPLG